MLRKQASEAVAICLPLAYKDARRKQGQRDSQDRWQQAVKKMKYLILFISLIYSAEFFAQDPDLVQTWYLQELFYIDPQYYYIDEIDPSINPFITISANLYFEGQGACNTFNGNYTQPVNGEVTTVSFNNSTTNCDFPVHNSFEDSYFGFMSDWWYYYIEDDGIGQRLTIYQPLDPYAIFTNYPLSVSDNEITDIAIYPNPTNAIINITSQQDSILGIQVFDLLGNSILSQNTNLETVDISDLDTGIYLIKISTEQKSTIKKIIKN